MADFQTFKNLYDEVTNAVKDFGDDQLTLVKHVINMTYFEMLSADTLYPMFWMVDMDDTQAAVGEMTITAITAADPGVITVDAVHGLSTSDIVSVYSIVGTTELNNRTFKVNSVPLTTTLSLIDLDGLDAIDTTSLTAYVSGGKILHRGRSLAVTGKNVQRILNASWHDEPPMTEITNQELEAETKWWDHNQTRPTRYMLRKKYSTAGVESNQLLWFPGSDDAYDLRYWFEGRPSILSGDDDVPMMPPVFHTGISAGAIARLAEYDVQVNNAVIWPQIYMQTKQSLVEFNRKWWREHDPTMDASRQGKPYML